MEASDCIYRNPSAPIEARIKDLLSRMTLREKIGQMTQIERTVATTSAIRDFSIGTCSFLDRLPIHWNLAFHFVLLMNFFDWLIDCLLWLFGFDFAGSILNAGGSAPFHNALSADWTDMIDGFQKSALQSRLGVPIIYGSDAVHGNNNVYGATIFPHNVGLGATRLINLSLYFFPIHVFFFPLFYLIV